MVDQSPRPVKKTKTLEAAVAPSPTKAQHPPLEQTRRKIPPPPPPRGAPPPPPQALPVPALTTHAPPPPRPPVPPVSRAPTENTAPPIDTALPIEEVLEGEALQEAVDKAIMEEQKADEESIQWMLKWRVEEMKRQRAIPIAERESAAAIADAAQDTTEEPADEAEMVAQLIKAQTRLPKKRPPLPKQERNAASVDESDEEDDGSTWHIK